MWIPQLANCNIRLQHTLENARDCHHRGIQNSQLQWNAVERSALIERQAAVGREGRERAPCEAAVWRWCGSAWEGERAGSNEPGDTLKPRAAPRLERNSAGFRIPGGGKKKINTRGILTSVGQDKPTQQASLSGQKKQSPSHNKRVSLHGREIILPLIHLFIYFLMQWVLAIRLTSLLTQAREHVLPARPLICIHIYSPSGNLHVDELVQLRRRNHTEGENQRREGRKRESPTGGSARCFVLRASVKRG